MANIGVTASFFHSALENFNIDNKFDVVTMNETLEHVYSPYSVIRQIIDKFLSPNGLFAGHTPYLFTCNCEQHLHYFSVNSLRQFLEQFFHDVKIDKKNYYDAVEDHFPEYHLTFLCRSPK
jgi:2-polyprenyl-3-methyl-5-hydroxy-6-metoxy-1,4-benzoquinol methylase